MKYRLLTKKENEQVIIHIIENLLDDSIPYSGAHRKKQWERGWGENLESGNDVPKYFGKYPVQRLNGKFVKGLSSDYERQMLYTIVDKLARKYLYDMDNIVEFGCGTGHNLWRIKEINPNALLIGADWTKSSNKIIESQGFVSWNFDFFNPPSPAINKYNKKRGFYTVAALEQVGTKFKPFVKFLLKSKPSVIVHIEPMPEYLDSTKLNDYLSIQYMKKRKYLRGYRDYIEELERKGKVKILESRRSGIGSMFIDGYSILVWKPL